MTRHVTSFAYSVTAKLPKNNNRAVYTKENKARLSLAAGYLSGRTPRVNGAKPTFTAYSTQINHLQAQQQP